MLAGKKIVVVLPAYNAAKTLAKTLSDVPEGVVDQYILVDDCSRDATIEVARQLSLKYPLLVVPHDRNLGYGGNQKTCYREALLQGAEVVVMLHPDYQYEPKLLGALASLVATDVYDVALGSRILGKGALEGGMPLYKYIFNRMLTLIENLCIGQKLSEYHTGYRAFSRQVLEGIPFRENSDDFVFDNEMLVQCHVAGFRMGELSVPTKYFEEASSINFRRSVIYGLGVLACSAAGLAARLGLWCPQRFRVQGRKSARRPTNLSTVPAP
jgi:glycosyltransferase involved in cell wall biosynthesis